MNTSFQYGVIPATVPFRAQVFYLTKPFVSRSSWNRNDDTDEMPMIGLEEWEITAWVGHECNRRRKWWEDGYANIPHTSIVQGPYMRDMVQRNTFLSKVEKLRKEFDQRENLNVGELALILDLEEYDVQSWVDAERLTREACWNTGREYAESQMRSTIHLLGTPSSMEMQGDGDQIMSATQISTVSQNSDLDLSFDNSGQEWQFASSSTCAKRRHGSHELSVNTSATSMTHKKRPRKNQKQSRATAVSQSHLMHQPVDSIVCAESHLCLFESKDEGSQERNICSKSFQDYNSYSEDQTRHHFPKYVFVCWLQTDHGIPCAHGPVYRKDNFQTHLAGMHQFKRSTEIEKQKLKKICEDRRIEVKGYFHDRCGFCSKFLKTRDESFRHIYECSNGKPASKWTHCCTDLSHILKPGVHYTVVVSSDISNYTIGGIDFGRNGGFGGSAGGSSGTEFGYGPGGHNVGSGLGGNQSKHSSNSPSHGHVGKYCTFSLGLKDATQLAIGSKASEASLGCHHNTLISNSLDWPFRVVRKLGYGGFGHVDEVLCDGSTQSYARKTFHRRRETLNSPPDTDRIKNELEILRRLKHPHLIQFVGYYILGHQFHMLMSPVADGNLGDLLRHSKVTAYSSLDSRKGKLLKWMECLKSAVAYLHSHFIQHKDIKPQNILVKGSQIFLADFGNATHFFDLACQDPSGERKVTMTPMYCAPETVSDGAQDSRADIFSLGCVYAEMITWVLGLSIQQFEAFRSSDKGYVAYHKTLPQTFYWIEGLSKSYNHMPKLLKHVPLPFNTVRDMLQEDPSGRPKACDLKLCFPRSVCCCQEYRSYAPEQDESTEYSREVFQIKCFKRLSPPKPVEAQGSIAVKNKACQDDVNSKDISVEAALSPDSASDDSKIRIFDIYKVLPDSIVHKNSTATTDKGGNSSLSSGNIKSELSDGPHLLEKGLSSQYQNEDDMLFNHADGGINLAMPSTSTPNLTAKAQELKIHSPRYNLETGLKPINAAERPIVLELLRKVFYAFQEASASSLASQTTWGSQTRSSGSTTGTSFTCLSSGLTSKNNLIARPDRPILTATTNYERTRLNLMQRLQACPSCDVKNLKVGEFSILSVTC